MIDVKDAHETDARFLEYYQRESLSDRMRARALGIRESILRLRSRLGLPVSDLHVADIGCNAGSLSRVWLEDGHRVAGLDISRDLIAIARERSAAYSEHATFEVGTATDLPWEDERFDVCLLPELLEHVEAWDRVLSEGLRVLKPHGMLYLSTTNVLCPKQQEFNLPLYSWYPSFVKRRCEAAARTTSPQIANFATHPAVHWFSPYQLARFLGPSTRKVYDRFDIIDEREKSAPARAIISLIRRAPPIRLLGHVLTPSTILIAVK